MNGQAVGRWSLERRSQQRFSYEASWLEHPLRRPISLALPLRPRAYAGREVAHYFEALLPTCPQVRARLGRCFGAPEPGPLDLLAELGRDCAGALQFLPPEEDARPPGGVAGIALSPASLHKLLGLLHRAESFRSLKEGLRHCLPGRSPKAALLKRQGQWFLPDQWTATSHIVRLASEHYCPKSHWLYLKLLQGFGVATAHCQLLELAEGEVALVAERFDRRWCDSGQKLMRLPCEDIRQALGPRSRGLHPLEEIRRLLALLVGSSRTEDRERFLRRLLLQALLGGPALKALRTSLFIEAEGRFRLAPAFHYRAALASEPPLPLMAWLDAGQTWRTRSLVLRLLKELLEQRAAALERAESVLPDSFPARLWDTTRQTIRSRAEALEGELACTP
jgi:serine/threonine-protein kinase HipA